MGNRRKLWIATCLGALATAFTVGAACSADPVRMLGDAMVDAGHAVDATSDALVPDAQAAPMAFDATCTMVERTTNAPTSDGTNVIVTDQWWALVSVPGLTPDQVRRVDVVLCDYEFFGVSARGNVNDCPDGGTCSGDLLLEGSARPPVECTAAAFGLVETGRLRVNCGTRTRITSALGPSFDYDSGATAHTAHVYLETL